MSHWDGACYRISGDNVHWGMEDKVRRTADEIMRIANMYGVPCWDDSTLWWRLERFRIWVSKGWKDGEKVWERDPYHFGEYGKERRLEYEVDKMEKQASQLCWLMTLCDDTKHLEKIADELKTPPPIMFEGDSSGRGEE